MAFKANGEAFELVEQGEGLLDDRAQLPSPWTPLVPRWEMIGTMRRRASSWRSGLLSYPLSASSASGRRRGRPGRPTTGGIPSTRSRAVLT